MECHVMVPLVGKSTSSYSKFPLTDTVEAVGSTGRMKALLMPMQAKQAVSCSRVFICGKQWDRKIGPVIPAGEQH